MPVEILADLCHRGDFSTDLFHIPVSQQSGSKWKQSNWDFYKESRAGFESQMHFKSSKAIPGTSWRAICTHCQEAIVENYTKSSNCTLEQNSARETCSLFKKKKIPLPQLSRKKSIFTRALLFTLSTNKKKGKKIRKP